MIDREVQIFNRVYAKAAPLCAKGKFSSTIINSKPTALPAASLIEMDNITIRGRQSSTPTENFALITYQLEVYATSKSECRKVYAAVDDEMISMNFSRMGGQYINMPENMKLFMYVARYEAAIDADGNLYRRS